MNLEPIETDYIFANTKKQRLCQHLFAVGFIAYKIIDRLNIKHERLQQSAFLAGLLHDIGKIDPQFQKWILKKKHSRCGNPCSG